MAPTPEYWTYNAQGRCEQKAHNAFARLDVYHDLDIFILPSVMWHAKRLDKKARIRREPPRTPAYGCQKTLWSQPRIPNHEARQAS